MARIQSMQNYSKQYSDPKYFSPEQTELYGEMSQTIYHEKQVKALCALHVLNNLFQDGTAFKKQDLDEICQNLDPSSKWFNQHKSIDGWGNYDVNVLKAALELKNYEVVWFDKRRDPTELDFGNIFGFILNVKSPYDIGWLTVPYFKGRHWIAIRNIPSRSSGERYYNLDSKLGAPIAIGTEGNVVEYFRQELAVPNNELMLVVTKDVERTRSWRRNSGNQTE